MPDTTRQSSLARALAAVALALTALANPPIANAEESSTVMRLASPYSSHMVVQRDVPVPIWGVDSPGATVRITARNNEWTTTAGTDGRWKIEIGPFAVGAPFEINIQGSETFALQDVLAGEVWLASGQSNMEWPLSSAKDGERDLANADIPEMRLLTIPRNGTVEPVEFVANDGWQPCTPQTAASFSAVAYHFGRELHDELGVPIGLVCNAWGGASMETYTRLGVLADDAIMSHQLTMLDDYLAKRNAPGVMDAYRASLAKWEALTEGRGHHNDPGDNGAAQGWTRADFDDTSWKQVQIPTTVLQEVGSIDGAFWFRRSFDVPTAWAGKDLALSLGVIDSVDVAWVNGVEVGRTGNETPGYWSRARRYTIPGAVVHAGRNTITVRVFEQSWTGDPFGQPGEMAVAPADGSAPGVALAGDWKYRVAVELMAKPKSPLPEERDIPTLLYNGMVRPLVPMRFRGVIWYQGETNSGRWQEYRHLNELMITDWRRQFDHGDFPFLFVQLAGYEAWPGWLELMVEQQRCLEIPATGMAVAADLGEIHDIHPRNKRDVAHRLALIARATVYGEDVVFSGPTLAAATRDGSRIRLSFNNVGGGLMARSGGEDVGSFEIAGVDGEFLPGKASIDGGTIVVSNQAVGHPARVRYAWRNFPDCDLANREGLPASPFETTVP